MRHLLKTAAIASSLVAASFAVGTGMAQAADQVVNFQGTVDPYCIFGASTVGTLGNIPGTNYLGTDPASNGIDAQVELNCTGNAAISVTDITDNGSAPDILPGSVSRGAIVTTSFGSTDTTNGFVNPPVFTGPTGTNEQITVGMYITTVGAVPPGTYKYKVTVTAAPL